MRTYNKIKNIIIALMAAMFYCNSSMETTGSTTGIVIFGTIGMFGTIGFIMFEMDSIFGINKRRRKQEDIHNAS